MPNPTTPDAPFVPYTVDVQNHLSHQVLQTALGLYANTMEALSKKMVATGIDASGVIERMGTVDDLLSVLHGQYTLFNSSADDANGAVGEESDPILPFDA